jgi:hypothetical protein
MIDKRGLAAHKGSCKCYRYVITKTINEHKNNGYVVFHRMGPTPKLLYDSKLFKRDIVGYYTDKRDKVKGFTYGYWGPKWLFPLWDIKKYLSKQVFIQAFEQSIKNGCLTPEAQTILANQYVFKGDIPKRKKNKFAKMIMEGKVDEAVATIHLECEYY